MSREQAMINFVREMEKFDSTFAERNRDNRKAVASPAPAPTVPSSPSRSASVRMSAPMSGQNDSSSSIKGTLFKQRDVFKGWRPRLFELQDNFLHYYMEESDPLPKGSMDICGCSVTSIKPTKVDGVEYFPFVITHPNDARTYNLASDKKSTADEWIAKIIEASKKTETLVTSASGNTEDRLLQRRPVSVEEGERAASLGGRYKAVKPEVQLAGGPFEHQS